MPQLDTVLLLVAVLMVAVAAGLALGLRALVRLVARRIATEIEARLSVRLATMSQEIMNATAVAPLGQHIPIFLGEFSIDSFHARHLVQHLLAHTPRTVVELGSGSSTILIEQIMQRVCAPGYRHIAVDHDAQYLEVTRRSAAANGSAERVEFFLCPLAPVPKLATEWYSDLGQSLGECRIDLLVVDGPPAYLPEWAQSRYPALPMLYSLLSERCTILLDDANRPGERAVLERWVREYPEFSLRRLPEGKGLAVLSRSG